MKWSFQGREDKQLQKIYNKFRRTVFACLHCLNYNLAYGFKPFFPTVYRYSTVFWVGESNQMCFNFHWQPFSKLEGVFLIFFKFKTISFFFFYIYWYLASEDSICWSCWPIFCVIYWFVPYLGCHSLHFICSLPVQ